MSFKEATRQIGVIFSHELKQSFKDWKVVLILLVYLSLFVGSIYLVDFAEDRVNYIRERQSLGRARSIDLFDAIESEYGSLNFFFPFAVSLIVIPLVVLFLSFNVISSERYYNSIRYLVSKVSRFSVLLGKFLSHVFIMLFAILIFNIIGAVYIYFKLGEPLIFVNLFYSWLFLTLYSMALISFITFLSTFTRRSFTSIGLGIFGLIIMHYLLSSDWLKWFSIFHYLKDSIKGFSERVVINFAMMVVFTVVFVFLGHVKLKRTDL